MRLRFDQLGKQIGRAALGASGTTVAHHEIAPDAQHADLWHEPDPARAAERERLGLLGRLAATLCLIELFSHPPDRDEVLACIGKLIAFRQQRARASRQHRARAVQGRQQPEASPDPLLWILAAGRPTVVLEELWAKQAPDWPAGVYVGPELLRVRVVVASELPRDRSTVLVRLMAAGPGLARAIEDLAALPADAPERAVADAILLKFEHVLGTKPSPTPEEEEFIMAMRGTWEQARELGRNEGHNEARARDILTVLRARGIVVSDAARERILAERDPELLERWLEKAVVAGSVAEVIDEPS